MAQRIIYTCDNCAAETEIGTSMWAVQVSVKNLSLPLSLPSSFPTIQKCKQWCRPCLEQIHLLPPVKTPVEKLPPPLTFEETLRAIIREEVEDLTGAAQ